jgi:hypothetical protein
MIALMCCRKLRLLHQLLHKDPCLCTTYFPSFIYLLTSQTKGKEPLVDSQSHVITSYQNLQIMLKKNQDKATAKEIAEDR